MCSRQEAIIASDMFVDDILCKNVVHRHYLFDSMSLMLQLSENQIEDLCSSKYVTITSHSHIPVVQCEAMKLSSLRRDSEYLCLGMIDNQICLDNAHRTNICPYLPLEKLTPTAQMRNSFVCCRQRLAERTGHCGKIALEPEVFDL